MPTNIGDAHGEPAAQALTRTPAQALTALLQLTSPALPIGGYSYSQGLEAAVECALVTDEASAMSWIGDQLMHVVTHCEAPVWVLLFDAWSGADHEGAAHWNAWFHASRETRELRYETEQMGWSLARLGSELAWITTDQQTVLNSLPVITLPVAHACCAQALGLDRRSALAAYLFTWIENQVMAAIKAVPLGQMAGQRMLDDLRRRVGEACDEAVGRAAASPPQLDTFAPQLAVLSARHETQYSRLFRS